MKQNIIHIGLDVDDTQYHGSALNHTTGKILDLKCRPNLKGLLGQLDKLHKYFPGSTFKLYYDEIKESKLNRVYENARPRHIYL